MSARPIVTAGIAGTLLAGGLAALAPERASSGIACFNLVPDIVAFARPAPSSPICGCVLSAIAGGVIAVLFSMLALGRNNNSLTRFALLLSNPLLLLAFAKGAETSLLLAAMMVVASAALALAASRDYRAAVLVGLALAGAPFLSNSLLYLYPALLIALPLVSPWGLGLRRLAGFSVVVWSPFAMALIGLAYLHWLIGDFGAALAAPPPLREVFCPDYLALTASAALMAFAARGLGLARPLAAFIIGGAFVAASQTGLLAALH